MSHLREMCIGLGAGSSPKWTTDRNIQADETTPLQTLLRGIKFATNTRPGVSSRLRRRVRDRADRNSRRPRAFAGTVGSLNSIHWASDSRIIQLRVFSTPFYIYIYTPGCRRVFRSSSISAQCIIWHLLCPAMLASVCRISHRRLLIVLMEIRRAPMHPRKN